jgi:Protein of unknown function (DUF2510)
MSGQIAATGSVSLGIIGAIIGLASLYGVVDVLRQPGWAWRRAGRNRMLFLAMVVVFPSVGLAIYLFAARPKVAPLTRAGRIASLPLEGLDIVPRHPVTTSRLYGTISPPNGLMRFGVASRPVSYNPFGAASSPVSYNPFGATSSPVGDRPYGATSRPVGYNPFGATSLPVGHRPIGAASSPVSSARSGQQVHQQPITVHQGRRPPTSSTTVDVEATKATINAAPAGWKSDPTGRYQFRYWDGGRWTDSVARSGIQSKDPVSA